MPLSVYHKYLPTPITPIRKETQNKIGPWKLGRTLGRGSTGRVRLAKNTTTGQLAAVKIVLNQISRN